MSHWKLPPQLTVVKAPREMPERRDWAGWEQQVNSTQASIVSLLQLLVFSIGSDDAYSGPDPMSQC